VDLLSFYNSQIRVKDFFEKLKVDTDPLHHFLSYPCSQQWS
jgi:hypothetical protein